MKGGRHVDNEIRRIVSREFLSQKLDRKTWEGAALTGGVLFLQITRKLDEHLAKMLILAGKGKLLQV